MAKRTKVTKKSGKRSQKSVPAKKASVTKRSEKKASGKKTAAKKAAAKQAPTKQAARAVAKKSTKGSARSTGNTGRPTPEGFVLGDHRFFDPSQDVSYSFDEAISRKRPKQIIGAPPPTYLDGLTRDAGKDSPAAKALLRGKFCGHGEPAMTVFDLVIDGQSDLEINGFHDDEENPDGNLRLLPMRRPGGEWVVIYRREWEENQATLEGVTREPVRGEEGARLVDDTAAGRVSVGFEYPSDADSRDCVTWMTIDVLLPREKKPRCLVNAELA
jgi:hypothetical protein